MSHRIPVFEAARWVPTDHGWAAVIELDWPRCALQNFDPGSVCIDEIVYQVTNLEVRGVERPFAVWIWTLSDLDEIPRTTHWMVPEKSPGIM